VVATVLDIEGLIVDANHDGAMVDFSWRLGELLILYEHGMTLLLILGDGCSFW